MTPEDVAEARPRDRPPHRTWLVGDLGDLDDLRESVHLRALAKESPIDEFHRAAISAFKNLAAEAVDEAAKSFREVTITADGVDLDAEGMGRPSSTWTYMVNDNPLSGGDSAIGAVAAMFR